MTTRIAIIGGGAAGCFAAICLKERMPEACVTVYELSLIHISEPTRPY